jgi:phosphatidylinositol 4-kinase
MSHREIDAAKAFSSQIAIKGYFAGEAAGIRLANHESRLQPTLNVFVMIKSMIGIDQTTLPSAPPTEIDVLKSKLSQTLEGIREKSSKLTVHDLRRLLFRCAATIIAMENASFVYQVISISRVDYSV